MDNLVGKMVKLVRPVRPKEGKQYFKEQGKIIKEIDNLGRTMFVVLFEDDVSVILFRDEFEIE